MSNCMNEKWRPTLLSGSKSSTFCRRRMNQKYRKAGKTFLRLKVQSLNFKPSMMSNCMNEKWIKCPPCQSLAPASLYESPLRAGSGLHTQYDSLLFCFHQTLQISLPHCQSPVWALLCIGGAPLASRFDDREAFCSSVCTVCSCAQAGGLTQTDKLNRSELLRASLHHWTSRSQVPKPILPLLVQL